MSRPVLVLPSPPTANGDLHLGHLAGPYLAADAFARYRRMQGHAVAYVTGADVHQSYVVEMARREGVTPLEMADRFADRIEDTLRAADIEVDAFVRPHRSATYQRFVGEFFRRLSANGHLTDEARPTLWCSSCERFLLGAAVRGTCAGCNLGTDGALCESCGRPVDHTSLGDPHCVRCGAAAELRPLRRLWFSARELVEPLREYHAEQRMRPHSYEVVQALLADGLFDTPITSPLNWGVPVPFPGFEDQRFDVWAEVGPGYAAATAEATAEGQDPESWREYWCSDDAEIVQFFGFDNTVPHTLLYPALDLASGELRPPDHYVINEFHRLDGEKFSTSRRHAVWGGDILEAVDADGLRYYLCLTAPEDEPGNFTLSDFMTTTNADLVDEIGPLIDRVLRLVVGTGPVPTHDGVVGELRDRALEIGQALEPRTFSLRKAARIWRDMARHLSACFALEEAEVGASETNVERLVGLEALSLVACAAYPLMPSFARDLWDAIGAADDLSEHPWAEPVRHLASPLRRSPSARWFSAVTEEQLRPLSAQTVDA